MNFLPKFNLRGPYKNSENFAQSQILLRKYFLTKSFVPSSQEVFLHYYRLFLENWIFDGNSSGADLTKIKFRTILNCAKFLYYLKLWKIEENITKFFWLNYLFHSSKERFLQKIRQFLENWIFCWNSTGADLTKIMKILYYILNCAWVNIFWLNFLFHSSKERFLHNFKHFLENWIFDGNSTGADLTK